MTPNQQDPYGGTIDGRNKSPNAGGTESKFLSDVTNSFLTRSFLTPERGTLNYRVPENLQANGQRRNSDPKAANNKHLLHQFYKDKLLAEMDTKKPIFNNDMINQNNGLDQSQSESRADGLTEGNLGEEGDGGAFDKEYENYLYELGKSQGGRERSSEKGNYSRDSEDGNTQPGSNDPERFSSGFEGSDFVDSGKKKGKGSKRQENFAPDAWVEVEQPLALTDNNLFEKNPDFINEYGIKPIEFNDFDFIKKRRANWTNQSPNSYKNSSYLKILQDENGSV